MSDQNGWDHSVDVLVVGSGNGGLTAALCCHEMGDPDVLVIEKADKYGGTSATSGGGVWVPCNRYAKAAGADDSIEEAREYLRHTIPAGQVPDEMIDAYVEHAPKMIDFLHERTHARYRTLEHYPDYYSNLPGAKPGHRSMEPEPVDASLLGDDFRQLTLTHHMMRLFGLIHFTQVDAQILTARLPGWFTLTLKMILGYLVDFPWRFKSRIARRLCTGSAGIARLRLSMKDRDLPLWLNASMTELITDNGRVVGAVIERDGRRMRIQARKGVILAAGGFEHNQSMREEYLPKPTNTEWSAGVTTNTGDAIREGLRLGATTRLMDSAWWCTTISVPGEPVPRLSIMEKSLPGSCVVNRKGERFANESQNYMAFQQELYRVHSDDNPCQPSWHIFDARFRRNYIVGPLLTAQLRPDWTVPREWYDKRFVGKAGTIRELAVQMGIDPDGLQRTVAQMNEYARTGKDEDFQRGDATYDRYYGDPAVKPNPCLAPIDEAPFYAMQIDAGDFGTQGGLATNINAQVIGADENPIDGLYAIGNCSAAVLPTYPGPGSTLGPAMTFGYLAARHITGYGDGADTGK